MGLGSSSVGFGAEYSGELLVRTEIVYFIKKGS